MYRKFFTFHNEFYQSYDLYNIEKKAINEEKNYKIL